MRLLLILALMVGLVVAVLLMFSSSRPRVTQIRRERIEDEDRD